MNFSKYLFAVWMAIAGASAARAEIEVIENADDQDGLTVFRMTVSPAAEPQPALKHRIWTRPHNLKPGNAAMHYVRSYAENWLEGTWRSVRNKYGDFVEEFYSWDLPIDELPLESVREVSAAFDDIVQFSVRPATMCRDSDWGLELMDLRGPESIEFRLPDFQQSRSIARMLALRTRLAIAEGRYDDAIDHLRMQHRLARDVGQELFLICNLIGIAMESVAWANLHEFIAAPDSPNLYWALAEIPSPLVDCSKAVRLEMSLGLRIFPTLLEVETVEHSHKEWARLFREAIVTMQQLASNGWMNEWDFGGNLLKGMDVTVYSVAAYPAAKQRLLDSGMILEQVDQMAVGHVLLLDTAREYQRVADQVEKWWYVPYSQSRERIDEAEDVLRDSSKLNLGKQLADMLLPAIRAVQIAQIRSVWKKNAVLVVEAIRMHAAETGELPKSLTAIQVVPVPMNPITTNPYEYYLEGSTAVLELPFTDGMPGVAYRYEISLKE